MMYYEAAEHSLACIVLIESLEGIRWLSLYVSHV